MTTKCPGCGVMVLWVLNVTMTEEPDGTWHLTHPRCGFGVVRHAS